MLSDSALSRIDREAAKYPADQKRSAVIAALAIAQDEHGWLSAEAMDDVARHLGLPTIAVYEVATFYSMFELKPTGRFKLTLCTNLPCALSGAATAAEHLKKRLGIGFGETTGDGKFTLKEGECFGACGDAPVILVNNKRMVSFMNPPQLDALLDELSAAADRGEGAGATRPTTRVDGPPRGASSTPSAGSAVAKPAARGDV
ncbi:MAG TPA: NADH-quinone oxidoreductase subunit NuoE [Gemmatimonadaceae bacterium]